MPTAKITERCNDGDGCILRLFLSSSVGSTAAGAVRVKFFSTTQNSTVWRLHSLDGDLESTGSTTDGSSQGIESVTADDRNCLFSEERPTGDYALLALNSTIQPISNCVLRIDD